VVRYPPSVFDHYVTSTERDLRLKSRRRLRLLQITLGAWAVSVAVLVGLMLRG
jgi:hypothetical protein